jgi:hypothetical protein
MLLGDNTGVRASFAVLDFGFQLGILLHARVWFNVCIFNHSDLRQTVRNVTVARVGDCLLPR